MGPKYRKQNTHARFDQTNKSRPDHQRMEPSHPGGVQNVAVVAEAQNSEAGLDDGTPGRVHGGHEPEFPCSFRGMDGRAGRRLCVDLSKLNTTYAFAETPSTNPNLVEDKGPLFLYSKENLVTGIQRFKRNDRWLVPRGQPLYGSPLPQSDQGTCKAFHDPSMTNLFETSQGGDTLLRPRDEPKATLRFLHTCASQHIRKVNNLPAYWFRGHDDVVCHHARTVVHHGALVDPPLFNRNEEEKSSRRMAVGLTPGA